MLGLPAALAVVLSTAAFDVLVATSRWSWAARAAASTLGSYWIAMGAWLRTSWPEVVELPPRDGAPSARTMRLMIAIGLVAVISCTIALAVQALVGGWSNK